jgi:hypothetical protein
MSWIAGLSPSMGDRAFAYHRRMDARETALTQRPWPVSAADAIVCINVIHISPWEATLALMAGAGRILPAGGVLVTYSPYRRGGAHTSPSNGSVRCEPARKDPGAPPPDFTARAPAVPARAGSSVSADSRPAWRTAQVHRQTCR